MNFNNLFGKLAPGMCRMTMNGNIAVKTTGGYKTYNVKNETLTNVTNFCFDMGNMGMDMFFLMPATTVKVGDIILIDGKPKCVTKTSDKKKITCIDYETSEEKTIIPERHVFMGNTVFYAKITSLLGGNFGKGKGMGNIMKMMMASQLMGGNAGAGKDAGMGGFGQMMAMSMMMGGDNNMFANLFDDLNFDGLATDEDGEADETENEKED